MEWKHVVYSDRNPGRPVPAIVTPLDLREAAQATSPSPAPPLPTLLMTPPKGKKQKKKHSPLV